MNLIQSGRLVKNNNCIRIDEPPLSLFMKRLLLIFSILQIVSILNPVNGQQAENSPAKPYHIFNPVPRISMRDFSIDRPDVTESPITVDAGHFQFEGDLYKWSGANQGNNERVINVFNGLYKMGLTKSWDIHIGVEMYNLYKDPEGKTIEKGYGNTTIRLKHNFWGNDGEKRTALGLIPYITFPTSPVDKDILYGFAFPFSYDLTEKYGAGAQFQFDFAPNEKGDYTMSYLQTVVIGGPLIGALDFYAEVAGIFSESSTTYSANGGLIYNLNSNLKIDIATNVGLVKEAPTRIYLGLSFRI